VDVINVITPHPHGSIIEEEGEIEIIQEEERHQGGQEKEEITIPRIPITVVINGREIAEVVEHRLVHQVVVGEERPNNNLIEIPLDLVMWVITEVDSRHHPNWEVDGKEKVVANGVVLLIEMMEGTKGEKSLNE